MASYVAIALLNGSGTASINPEEVFALAPVPLPLLPVGVANGTYVHFEIGIVSVVGDVATVAAALAAAGSGSPPSGPAGGDLLGTYPNPLVQPVGFASVLYVDPIAGNDLTALRGSELHRFATIQAALNAALTSDVVYLGPGSHLPGGVPITIPPTLARLTIAGLTGPNGVTVQQIGAGIDAFVWQPTGASRNLNLINLRVLTGAGGRAIVLNEVPVAGLTAHTVTMTNCEMSASGGTGLLARAVEFVGSEDCRVVLGLTRLEQSSGSFYNFQQEQSGAQVFIKFDPTLVNNTGGSGGGLRFIASRFRGTVTYESAAGCIMEECVLEGAPLVKSSGLATFTVQARGPSLTHVNSIFGIVGGSAVFDFATSPLPPFNAAAPTSIVFQDCAVIATNPVFTATELVGPGRTPIKLDGTFFNATGGGALTCNGFIDASVRGAPSLARWPLAVTGTATIDRDTITITAAGVVIGANVLAIAPPLPAAAYNVQALANLAAVTPTVTGKAAAGVTITAAAIGAVDVLITR